MSNAGDGDKRKVSTDALETLGNIIGPGERRDAIHLAVDPVVAAELMVPGEDIGLLPDGRASRHAPTMLGIVDPFLKAPVQPGERFWLVVYPRQIHSLRHVWTHPAFPDAPEVAGESPKLHAQSVDPKAASEAWLREFCKTADCPGYEVVMAEIMTGNPDAWDADEYLHFSGWDAHGEIPPEFWKHVEIVLGRKPEHTPAHFSCSC